MLRWLDAFAPAELERYPELGVVGGIVVGVAGGSDADFRPWRALADRGAGAIGDRSLGPAASQLMDGGAHLLRSAFGVRDISGAVGIARQAVRAEDQADGQFRVVALANLALLLYLSGDRAGARRALSQAHRDAHISRRPHGYVIALATGALLALDEGDAQAGMRSARQALDYAAAVGLADNQIVGLAHVAAGRARSQTLVSKEAMSDLDRGVELLRGTMLPAWHAYALLLAAPVAQKLGDSAGAYALLAEADALLAGFEDPGILGALQNDARRRLTMGRRRRRGAAGELTEAELAVLHQLRGPASQREIAASLSLSINTVKSHCSSIHRKLGVSSRADAVARAIGLAILTTL